MTGMDFPGAMQVSCTCGAECKPPEHRGSPDAAYAEAVPCGYELR